MCDIFFIDYYLCGVIFVIVFFFFMGWILIVSYCVVILLVFSFLFCFILIFFNWESYFELFLLVGFWYGGKEVWDKIKYYYKER